MKKLLSFTYLGSILILSSCVSKKKYTALETELNDTKSTLMQTRVDKEDCENKFAKIEAKVNGYYAKINSLQAENEEKLDFVEDLTVMSEKSKQNMRSTLKQVDQKELAQAKTLEDSINLAISHNLKKNLGGEEDDIDINVDQTVVQISISDKLLFKSGSYWVNPKAYPLLKRIAKVVNSEEAMEVMVEGHTDSQTIKKESYLQDNWDLSVRRSTSIVRLLQDKFNVDGKKLIAAGRSSYLPLADNSTRDGREKNRRTRILILPNLDKFLAMLEE
ncbi:OmpA family protein [Mesonia sp. HuA40]|uniref:OmpA/MotB family protein n=1 Tax=Mesonia sp. HuA40 TaxID=2602761 RepID=UPI0011CC547E|nr:OmpA family protein [Mesonia sp. HuA40]TXK70969.1 OmpA family protein [Mesonia sp. HuA40]